MKNKLLLVLFILGVLFVSCKDYDFENPVDPNNSPENPYNLKIDSFCEDTLSVSWEDKDEFPAGTKRIVKFEKSLNGSSFTIAGYDTVLNNQAKLIHNYFHSDTTYTFRISVSYSDNQTSFDNLLKSKLILRPSNLTTELTCDSLITLTWQDNSNFENYFEIEKVDNSGNFELVKTVDANTTSTEIEDVFYTGNNYIYRVRAVARINYSSYSTSAAKQLVFPSPTLLTVGFFIESEVNLTWQDNSTFEKGFEIERSTDNVNFYSVAVTPANATSTKITGSYLVGTNYYFRVKAISKYNNTIYNNAQVASIQFNAPSNLKITSYSETNVSLSWNDNSTYEQGYDIEMNDNGGSFTVVKQVGANITSASIPGSYLTDHLYRFRVRAKTTINYSAYSNIATASNLQFNPPSSLSANSFTETQVSLNWVDNSDNETGFEIERKTSSDSYSLIKTTSANVTSVSIDEIHTSGELYYYRVRAKSNFNYSDYSNETTQSITLNAPSNFKATNVTSTTAEFSWVDKSTFETGFELYESENGSTFNLIKTIGANSTSTSINKTYTYGKIYYYKIRAISNHNVSAFTSNISAGYIYPEFVYVSGGTYQMGDNFNEGQVEEKPVHQVTVSDFYMGKTEVTFEQYEYFCEQTSRTPPGEPGWGKGTRPVINVNWQDAKDYCDWLSSKIGKTVTLPTEAEWEYAARNQGAVIRYAGTSESSLLGNFAWYISNSNNKNQPVGTKAANSVGLFDMTGNVSEWCLDYYDETYYSISPANNPQGPTSGTERVFRGGGYDSQVYQCRASQRFLGDPIRTKYLSLGFRCVYH